MYPPEYYRGHRRRSVRFPSRQTSIRQEQGSRSQRNQSQHPTGHDHSLGQYLDRCVIVKCLVTVLSFAVGAGYQYVGKAEDSEGFDDQGDGRLSDLEDLLQSAEPKPSVLFL